jgi:hypothetical protein
MPASDDATLRHAPAEEHAPAGGAATTAPDLLEAPARSEVWCVAALCALSAARIFFRAATLPFFADTDEHSHFDQVYKFSREFWPNQQLTPLDQGTVKLMILHAGPEFLNEPIDPGKGPQFPAPIRDRIHQPGAPAAIQNRYDSLSVLANNEAFEQPL